MLYTLWKIKERCIPQVFSNVIVLDIVLLKKSLAISSENTGHHRGILCPNNQIARPVSLQYDRWSCLRIA